MLLRRSRLTLSSLVFLGAFPSHALAADVAHASSGAEERPLQASERPTPRSVVLLGVVGDSPEQRGVLQQSLAGELSALKPAHALEVTAIAGATRLWLDGARRNRSALLIVLLDLKGAAQWRVYLVDAARDRAIVRQFPGETAGNSAAIETVVSVVSSAVRALDEGLEIASRPVSELTEGSLSVAAATPRAQATAQIETARRWQLALGLGSALSTLESRVSATLGVFASARLASMSGLSLQASILRDWPAHFESEFGAFELQRTRGVLAAGAQTTHGAWQFSTEAGPALELLRRRVLETSPDARSSEGTDLLRAGVAILLSTRYGLSEHFAFALALQGAYFPQRIRYTLEPETQRVLAAPWRATATLQLGLELWFLR